MQPLEATLMGPQTPPVAWTSFCGMLQNSIPVTWEGMSLGTSVQFI